MSEHQTMLDDCEARESKLTEWEAKFIASLQEQIAERSLSQRQVEILERIWERVT